MPSWKWLHYANFLAILAICSSCTVAIAKSKSDNSDRKGSASAEPLSRAEAMTLLVDELKAPLDRGAVRKIAVLDLTDLDGNCSALGRFLAEELTTGLSRGGEIEVVERNRMRQILTDLNEFSAPDPETYKSLQQSLGVDAVVVGTLTPLGAITKINLRVISTNAGRVVAAGAQEFAMDGPLLQLFNTPCKGAGDRQMRDGSGAGAAVAAANTGEDQGTDTVKYVPGLWAEYFNRDDNVYNWPAAPIMTRVDSSPYFNWGTKSPAPRINVDHFAVRWTGQIYAPVAGMYTFSVVSDDGCMIRIGNKTLVEQWGSTIVKKTLDLRLDAGWHSIQIQYMEFKLRAHLAVQWSKPGEADFRPISGENLRCVKK